MPRFPACAKLPSPHNTMEAPKRASCDRCRAHKLKCYYKEAAAPACERCAKARTPCNRSPSLRTGRRSAKQSSSSISDVTGQHIESGAIADVSVISNIPALGEGYGDLGINLLRWDSATGEELRNSMAEFCNTPVSFAPATETRSDSMTLDFPMALSTGSPCQSSLEGFMDMSLPHGTQFTVDDFQDLNTIDFTTSQPREKDSSSTLSSISPPESYAGNPIAQPERSHRGQCNTFHMRQLHDLNMELQDLVSHSDHVSRSISTRRADGSSASASLVTETLGCSQQFLKILQNLQPKPLSCSACQRLGLHMASPSHTTEHTTSPPESLRVNTQTLSYVVGCFVHILRLYSTLIAILARHLEMHTDAKCLHFPPFFEGWGTQQLPIPASHSFQAIVLVQTLRYLLEKMESALGCRQVFDSTGTSESEGETSRLHELQPYGRTPKPGTEGEIHRSVTLQEEEGLLIRYDSLDLLCTMMRLEDTENKEKSAHRLRDVRSDLGRLSLIHI